MTPSEPPGPRRLPLAGVRVLDVGTRLSAPFCAALMGEQGADVIKVEQPGTGDFMRGIGPFEDGYSLWWSVEGRGRRSVTCNLRDPEGQLLFRRLAAHADVVVENFRPGTMEAWHVGPDDLDDTVVYVRISAFGQDGPYAQRPGLDRVGIAYGGLLHLTGAADGPPMRVGVNISDYLTGAFAAQAATAALYRRDASDDGRGEVVDAALHASTLRVLEWTLAAADRLGTVRERSGNRMSIAAPGDNYPTADGRYVSIVGGSDANFRRLCAAMERADLLDDARYGSTRDRAEHGEELNRIVTEWTTGLTADEVEARCIAAGVPVGVAYTATDILDDPHMRSRDDVIEVPDPVVGTVRQQAAAVRLQRSELPGPSGAPELGAHNDEVWCGLVGLTPADLAGARERGVV